MAQWLGLRAPEERHMILNMAATWEELAKSREKKCSNPVLTQNLPMVERAW